MQMGQNLDPHKK